MSDSATNANPPETTHSSAKFSELGVSEIMLASLQEARYHEPSPVQAGVIPVALSGRDVLGQARTGTGKTLAFGIPVLQRKSEAKRS